MRRAITGVAALVCALAACSSSSKDAEVALDSANTPAPTGSASAQAQPTDAGRPGASYSPPAVQQQQQAGARTTTPRARPTADPTCPTAAGEPPMGAGDGRSVGYTGTGSGSYTSPDGTGASYAFPPRWTYVWRSTEKLVELSATDAFGVWGIAAGSADERLSRLHAVYLTAPDGRGGSVTFSLHLATELPLTALGAGEQATARAMDESVVVTVRRPGSAASFEVTVTEGRCPASGGIGKGTITLDLDGAMPPWSSMHFGFDVRLEDDQLRGNLRLTRS